MSKNIFLLAGRTGGPFFPFPSYMHNLRDYKPIILGVKNSFEEKLSAQKNLELYFLPEVKLGFLSFKGLGLVDKLLIPWEILVAVFLVSFSVLKSVFLLLKFQPSAVVSTGSFLAVPVVFAATCLKKTRLISTKIIVHQQDPLPGLANRFAVPFADLVSCVFEYTKQNYSRFERARVIPNHILPHKYPDSKNAALTKMQDLNSELFEFVQKSTKPIMLIFGGGSGALFINTWLRENLTKLTEKFCVVHLYGALQTETNFKSKADYFVTESLFQEMPGMLYLADFVVCRSGLGSISELEFLEKNAFLVPLPNSHQTLNARLVGDRFWILQQEKKDEWLETILQKYNQNKNTNFNSKLDELSDYFDELKTLLSN